MQSSTLYARSRKAERVKKNALSVPLCKGGKMTKKNILFHDISPGSSKISSVVQNFQ